MPLLISLSVYVSYCRALHSQPSSEMILVWGEGVGPRAPMHFGCPCDAADTCSFQEEARRGHCMILHVGEDNSIFTLYGQSLRSSPAARWSSHESLLLRGLVDIGRWHLSHRHRNGLTSHRNSRIWPESECGRWIAAARQLYAPVAGWRRGLDRRLSRLYSSG